MFVTEEDYRVVIGALALQVVSQTEEAIRESAELEAVEEISGYLRPVYDTEAIFAAEGTERNSRIVMVTCDIALYHMAASASGRMGSEVREKRYSQATAWLKDVQAGVVVPDLPLVTDETTGQTGMPLYCGSLRPIRNTW